jgi:hypothetical protein
LGGQFYTSLTTTIFRIVILLAANFCVSVSWAYLYSLFCIITALYQIDPIGLFLTGHSKFNLIQNIFIIVAFALTLFASYIGALFAIELSK